MFDGHREWVRGPSRVYAEVGRWVLQTIPTFTDSVIYPLTLITQAFIHSFTG